MALSRRIIPALIGGVSDADLPPEFARYHTIDLSSDFEAGVLQIIDSLRSLEKSHEPPLAQAIDVPKLADEMRRRFDELDQRFESLGRTKAGPQVGNLEVDNELVFVIASFRADMEPAFEAIQCAAQEVGLRAERVKDVQGDYRITQQMLDMIRKAYLIVADLTHERPNVYFELGFARALDKKS